MRRPLLLRRYPLALAAALLLMVPVGAVHAQEEDAEEEDPLTVTLDDVQAFSGLAVDGDLLVMARYEIGGRPEGDYTATETFFAAVIRTDTGEILGSSSPYAYHDDGYGAGIISVYLPAVPSGFVGVLRIRMRTALTVSEVAQTQYSLALADYAGEARPDLAAWIKSAVGWLDAQWGVTLIDGATGLLTGAALEYVNRALPGFLALGLKGFSAFDELDTDYPTPAPAPTAGPFVTDHYPTNMTFGSGPNTFAGNMERTTGVPTGFWRAMLFAVPALAVLVFAALRLGPSAAVGLLGFVAIVGLPVALSQSLIPWPIGALFVASLSAWGITHLMQSVARRG